MMARSSLGFLIISVLGFATRISRGGAVPTARQHARNLGVVPTQRYIPVAALEIIRCFTTLCDKHRIDYFHLDGNLLGIMRNHMLIPWDNDYDLRYNGKPRADGYDPLLGAYLDDGLTLPECANVEMDVKLEQLWEGGAVVTRKLSDWVSNPPKPEEHYVVCWVLNAAVDCTVCPGQVGLDVHPFNVTTDDAAKEGLTVQVPPGSTYPKGDNRFIRDYWAGYSYDSVFPLRTSYLFMPFGMPGFNAKIPARAEWFLAVTEYAADWMEPPYQVFDEQAGEWRARSEDPGAPVRGDFGKGSSSPLPFYVWKHNKTRQYSPDPSFPEPSFPAPTFHAPTLPAPSPVVPWWAWMFLPLGAACGFGVAQVLVRWTRSTAGEMRLSDGVEMGGLGHEGPCV